MEETVDVGAEIEPQWREYRERNDFHQASYEEPLDDDWWALPYDHFVYPDEGISPDDLSDDLVDDRAHTLSNEEWDELDRQAEKRLETYVPAQSGGPKGWKTTQVR